jgi:serine/threonine protein kinase
VRRHGAVYGRLADRETFLAMAGFKSIVAHDRDGDGYAELHVAGADEGAAFGRSSDQFSLGVIAFEMLTGQKPFAVPFAQMQRLAVFGCDNLRTAVRQITCGGTRFP